MAQANQLRLSPVEAFVSQVLLDDALKKLNFLSSIGTNASVHSNELTQFMGEEITRIIKEQRSLEHKYEDLIMERGQLQGLVNKAKCKDVQSQIQETAQRLRESNKALCRNLKENPNVQGNLMKMQHERARVTEWLEETHAELEEFTFQGLMSKVEAERKAQELLNEVKRKERESSQAVKRLELELQKEYLEHEKETKVATKEIKDLKEELQKNKTVSAVELAFEERRLKAEENGLLRNYHQKEKERMTEVSRLQVLVSSEKQVHKRAKAGLGDRILTLNKSRSEWQERSEKDVNLFQEELELLKLKRQQLNETMKALQDTVSAFETEKREREEKEEFALFVARQQSEQEERMLMAAIFIQAQARLYLERKKLKEAGKKKGKKGKKKK